MKRFLKPGVLLLSILAGGQVNAHGPVAQQASTALTQATALFLADENQATQASYQGARVQMIGEERFAVELVLKGTPAKIAYICGLDDRLKPLKWGCKKK